jgi:nucleoside-diphosphate-sugar epimerase
MWTAVDLRSDNRMSWWGRNINLKRKDKNMKVFVTGATGFIGAHVVKELIAARHQVFGLARSDAGAKSLVALGAGVHRGSIEDIESLKRGASAADAVIHLAFNHDFSKFLENCENDRRAIEALGSVLTGTDKLLIVTSGLGGLGKPGRLATEDDTISPDLKIPRVSEKTALALKGVNVSAMRLPQVHDTVKQGLITYVIPVAREKGVSAYIGEGRTRWAATHVTDVAKAYLQALEKNEPGAKYHVVAEEGVTMKEIAEAIGKGLKVPVKSVPPAEAQTHFGWLAMFVSQDLAGSSAKTRQILGWKPTGPGLIKDLEHMNY